MTGIDVTGGNHPQRAERFQELEERIWSVERLADQHEDQEESVHGSRPSKTKTDIPG